MRLKPFTPQLLTTFSKALKDSSRLVRMNAAEALGKLPGLGARLDPLFTDLLSGTVLLLKYTKNFLGLGVMSETTEACVLALSLVLGKLTSPPDPQVRSSSSYVREIIRRLY